jgi:uncharacterized Fe-S radical SAM superfamily protein PflX
LEASLSNIYHHFPRRKVGRGGPESAGSMDLPGRNSMNMLSRRQFITSCLFMTASGLCLVPISLYSSCKQDEKRANAVPNFEPKYLKLHISGVLKKRGEGLWNNMASCMLCPRQCGANRLSGNKGFCGSDSELFVASYHPHFGEEKPLVGRGGSGAIFFSNCNLR